MGNMFRRCCFIGWKSADSLRDGGSLCLHLLSGVRTRRRLHGLCGNSESVVNSFEVHCLISGATSTFRSFSVPFVEVCISLVSAAGVLLRTGLRLASARLVIALLRLPWNRGCDGVYASTLNSEELLLRAWNACALGHPILFNDLLTLPGSRRCRWQWPSCCCYFGWWWAPWTRERSDVTEYFEVQLCPLFW